MIDITLVKGADALPIVAAAVAALDLAKRNLDGLEAVGHVHDSFRAEHIVSSVFHSVRRAATELQVSPTDGGATAAIWAAAMSAVLTAAGAEDAATRSLLLPLYRIHLDGWDHARCAAMFERGCQILTDQITDLSV